MKNLAIQERRKYVERQIWRVLQNVDKPIDRHEIKLRLYHYYGAHDISIRDVENGLRRMAKHDDLIVEISAHGWYVQKLYLAKRPF